MATEGQTAPKTSEELHSALSKAMQEGDGTAIAKLMAEVPEEEGVVETVPDEVPAQPESKEESAAGEESTSPDNWEDGLTDKQREKFNALKEERDAFDRKIRSELGRVPNLQREVAELKRRLQEPQPQPTPQAKEETPAPKQSKFAEKLAQIKEIDPVLADVLEEAIREIREKEVNPLREDLSNELKKHTDALTAREQDQVWNDERSKLLTAIPQAEEIFKLPLYKEWKAAQTPAMQALANSGYSDDVIAAINSFGTYVSVHHPELMQTPQATPAAPAVPANSQAAKVQEERNRKQGARQPTPTATAPRTGDGLPATEEEQFAYWTKQIREGKA